jgi:hypothetical protein
MKRSRANRATIGEVPRRPAPRRSWLAAIGRRRKKSRIGVEIDGLLRTNSIDIVAIVFNRTSVPRLGFLKQLRSTRAAVIRWGDFNSAAVSL